MHRYLIFLICTWSAFLLTGPASLRAAEYMDAPKVLEAIIRDQQLPHEGHASGVPLSYSWAQHPRIGMGHAPGDYQALTGWGQIYAAAETALPANTRIELRNIQTWILNKEAGTWTRVQHSDQVAGAAYREDFKDDIHIPPRLRTEANGNPSVKLAKGYNFHFWPEGRVRIKPDDIAGVITSIEARLIVDDPDMPDDRQEARILIGMGADYWKRMDSKWDNYKTNGDAMIGRLHYLTPEWQLVTATTLTELPDPPRQP